MWPGEEEERVKPEEVIDSLIIVCLKIKNEYYKLVLVYFDLQNVILVYVPIWVGQACQGVCGNVSIWIFAAGEGFNYLSLF